MIRALAPGVCRSRRRYLLEQLPGFLRRHDSASLRIPDALIDGSESFLVVVVENGSGILQIEFVRFRHRVIAGRISDRCNENRCPRQHRSHSFQESERMGRPAGHREIACATVRVQACVRNRGRAALQRRVTCLNDSGFSPGVCRSRRRYLLGQQLPDFLRRYDSASLGVPDAFVDGGKSFLVFVVEDRSWIFEIEFVRLRHRAIVGRIFDRCNENRCSR